MAGTAVGIQRPSFGDLAEASLSVVVVAEGDQKVVVEACSEAQRAAAGAAAV